jgi:hypothetical protein
VTEVNYSFDLVTDGMVTKIELRETERNYVNLTELLQDMFDDEIS